MNQAGPREVVHRQFADAAAEGRSALLEPAAARRVAHRRQVRRRWAAATTGVAALVAVGLLVGNGLPGSLAEVVPVAPSPTPTSSPSPSTSPTDGRSTPEPTATAVPSPTGSAAPPDVTATPSRTSPPSPTATATATLPAGLPLLEGGHSLVEGEPRGGGPVGQWAWAPCGTGSAPAAGGIASVEWRAENPDLYVPGLTNVIVEQVVLYADDGAARAAMADLLGSGTACASDGTVTTKRGSDMGVTLGDESLFLTLLRYDDAERGSSEVYVARRGAVVGLYGYLDISTPVMEVDEETEQMRLVREFVAAVDGS